jgi:UDP-N-acetylglucosamine 2-epimerase (non-hydrolysing)
MKLLNVVTFVGTRPEIIRLSRLIPLLDQKTKHTLVHTGQNNDPKLSDIFFSELGLRDPDMYLGVSNETFAQAMAETLIGAEKVFTASRPDAVVVLGDTNSAVAAIVARRMGIPVYHLEAGNRSFDENVPEEINRRLIDHVSTFNLPYSEPARRNLLAEGIHPRYICLSGSPLPEIINFYSQQASKSQILSQLEISSGDYIVASAHRQENVDSNTRLEMLMLSLNLLCEKYGKPVIFPVHPRTRKKLAEVSFDLNPLIRQTEPFGYFDYLHLQQHAFCVLSDSGTVSEESAILGFKAVTIRDSMERPELLEAGGISMAGLDGDNILRAVNFQTKNNDPAEVPAEYQIKNFSQRVFMFIESTAPRATEWQGLRAN